MLKWIIIAVLLNALLVFGGGRMLHSAKAVRMGTITPTYCVLLFPTADTPLFATENPADTTPVGTLDRAVLARYKEVLAGSIGVNLPNDGYAYARMSDLRFVADDPAPYVQGIRDALPLAGVVDLEFTTTQEGDAYDSRLVIQDDPHVRTWTYHYVTDGATVLTAYSPELDPGLIRLMQGYMFMVGLVTIGIVAGVVKLGRSPAPAPTPTSPMPPGREDVTPAA